MIEQNNGQFDRRVLKSLVTTAYQLQRQRIQTGLRIVGNIKYKLGQQAGKKEEDLDDKAKEILAKLRAEHKRISDTVSKRSARQPMEFEHDGLITNRAEYALARVYFNQLDEEEDTFADIEIMMKSHPMWPFFESVRGVGAAMAAVLISQIDMDRTPNLGNLYAYCGLDTVVTPVVVDGVETLVGVARSRKAGHMVEREYVDKKGKVATRLSVTYNVFLHDKLLGVCAECLVKGSGYFKTEVYNNYKFRLLNSPDRMNLTDGHIEAMARRYMIKIFMMYFYEEYCRVLGRELPPLYHEKKLGLKHTGKLFTGDSKRTEDEKLAAREAAAKLKEVAVQRKAMKKATA